MRLVHILRARIVSVLFRNRREDDLAEELRLHIERQVEYWIAQGVDLQEARLRARRQFGNVESLKEQSRDARGTATWDALVRDTRHATRRLLRDWRFSVPAVLLLGLGIGANTAIFSVVNAALFRPPPFANPYRLVDIYQNTKEGVPGMNTYPAYLDMTTATTVFSQLMTTTIPIPRNYREGRGPIRSGVVEYASASYPAVLGIQPSLGRWFTTDEDHQGAPVVAVIGHRMWTTRFGADPGIIGRTVYVQGIVGDGVDATIVGVGPEGYRGTINVGLITDFWLPIESAMGPIVSIRRTLESPFLVKARLRDSVTVAQAQAAMDVLGRRLAAEYPNDDPGKGISVFASNDVRIHPQMDTLVSTLASLLLAVVGLVLAVACSNLATLLLVRAATRAKEVSIRLAIGATRWQVVRHLLTESLVLSLAGGAAGCTFAWWLLRWLRTLDLPVVVDFGIDVRVLGFAVALSILTGVLFGLAPALNATRLDLLSVIREDGQTGSSGHRWFTLRNGLVVFQVTVSVVLLAATGAFFQVGVAARAQRMGFGVDGVAWLETDARYSGYTPDRAAGVYEELQRRVAALPGVDAVTLTIGPPMESNTLAIVTADRGSSEHMIKVSSMSAGPGFFDVMKIPLLFGRAIDARDRRGSPPVAVITESMARQSFGDVNAIGQRFRIDPQTAWIQVVGVVRDTGSSDRGSDLTDPHPQVFFLPVDQAAPPANVNGNRTVAARTSGDASALVRELQRQLLAIDPSLPVFSAMTMAQRVEQSLAAPYAVALSLGALGVLGLVLAGVGLYAVIAFAVSRRAREIGIRMALGAQSGDVVRDVARDTAGVLGAGAVVGLIFALMVILAMRTFSHVSTGVANIDIYRPSVDPLQLVIIVGFVSLVGLLAAFIPSRRAASVDPLAALRHE
ncbi:MAG TPA: ABC transporter permease [Vicinamibacterales bacterium]|jgi:predicted permease